MNGGSGQAALPPLRPLTGIGALPRLATLVTFGAAFLVLLAVAFANLGNGRSDGLSDTAQSIQQTTDIPPGALEQFQALGAGGAIEDNGQAPSPGLADATNPPYELSDESQQHLENAEEYASVGQFGLALVEINQIVAAEPDYLPASIRRDEIAARATASVRAQEQAIAEAARADAEAAAYAAQAAARAREQALTDYANYMLPKLQTVPYAAENLELDAQLLRLRPSLLYDGNWRLRVAAALFLYQSTGKELQNYAPVPAELRALDDTMVAFGKDLEYIADQMARGLDNPSGPYLDNATRRANGLQDRAQRITAQLNALE